MRRKKYVNHARSSPVRSSFPISNTTILTLLVIAFVLTMSGTFLTLTKFTELGDGLRMLTGAATSTATGQTNLTITATTAITVTNTQMNFGSGTMNSTCDYCIMDSNGINLSIPSSGTNVGDGRCCRYSGSVGFTGPGNNGFLVENTGNVNISVGYACSGNCTHALFIGGTRTINSNWRGSGIDIKVTANSVALQTGEDGGVDSASSCTGGGTLYRSSGWNITNSSVSSDTLAGGPTNAAVYTALSQYGHWLCGNNTGFPLRADNTQDAAVVDINITIPNDAQGTGVQSSFTMTFNATSAA